MDARNMTHVTQRKTGQRSKVAVIASENFEDAFECVAVSTLSVKEKAFILLSMSGGLRFTECQNVRVCDLKLEEGLAHIRVLKKKKKMKSHTTGKILKISPVYRWISIHPSALRIIKQVIEQDGLPHFSRVFGDIKRSTLDRHIRELFGRNACHHSISRHSHITYRLHQLKESPQEVAEQMQITLDVASGYNHINQKELVKKTWAKVG